MAINQDNSELLNRIRWIRIAILLVFVSLCLRLWHLTVIRYDHYRQLADNNRIRTLPLTAPRGTVLDRDGKVLADSVHSFNLLFFRDETETPDETMRFLTESVGVDQNLLSERLEAAAGYPRVRPVPLAENLSMDEVAYLLAHRTEHPELRTSEQPKRHYPHGDLASHVLGFIGEVSRRELEGPEFRSSRPGDFVGKTGIERVYNRHLTGTDGARQVLVNHVGKLLRELRRVEPEAGQTLRLTIDLDLQQLCESQLGDSPGAVVVLNPNSGEILALASKPGFDPNYFASRITAAQWKELVEDPDRPFQNRSVQSAFSPGSIFKVVMALAGLEYGLIDSGTSVFCNGGIDLYGYRFRCWRAGGHGHVSLREAIRQSCNVYFYVLGQKMGIDRIARFSERLGLGQLTGIDLDGEVSGVVPSTEWKKRIFGQRWYAGETISVAIGQGAITVTPLQLARAVGILATGSVPKLHLTMSGDTRRQGYETNSNPGFSEEHVTAVREAMWSVVNEWGTGHGARVTGFSVCGKTGTAQVIGRQARSKLTTEESERFVPNAWFVGFAPRENPEVVVAVIVQRGGSGGSAAAPMAGRILRLYYDKYQKEDRTGLELALQN